MIHTRAQLLVKATIHGHFSIDGRHGIDGDLDVLFGISVLIGGYCRGLVVLLAKNLIDLTRDRLQKWDGVMLNQMQLFPIVFVVERERRTIGVIRFVLG